MKKVIEIVSDKCTGCRACEQICPQKCITMKEDQEGFLYPSIDKEKCIGCGLCQKSCHMLNEIDRKDYFSEPEVYAMKPKDENIAIQSTSGGMFAIIAKYIFDKKGIVYGCEFDDELNARHIRIDNENDLHRLRGSKYVASNTLDTYSRVKKDLEDKNVVLYSGTGCQVAGLKSFLKKDYENLITVDLVCHGVPSQKIFSKYINWLENKLKDKVKKYDFRSKGKTRWGGGFTAKVETNSGKVKYLKADFDPYYSAFLDGKIYRESCYECKYANSERISDFTIADFWGIEKLKNKFYSDKGVSLVLINNVKAQKILLELKDIVLEKMTIEEASIKNPNLKKPTERKFERDFIYKNLENFDKCAKEYMLPNNKIKIIIKNCIPQKLKMFIKKYL